MLKCLKSYCNEEINNTLKRSVERFSNPDVLIKYNSRSRECLKEYVNKTKENFLDLNKKKTFPYSEYYDMLVNTIGKME